MSTKTRIGVAMGVLGILLASGSWVFGVYDARRNANQALILDASLRESGFVSSIRCKVHLFFGADPDLDGQLRFQAADHDQPLRWMLAPFEFDNRMIRLQ